MARAGTAFVQVKGDFGPLRAGLRSAESTYGRQLDSMSQRLKRGFTVAAKVAGVALAAGAAVGAKRSVDAAVNLGEQINKTKVVFRGAEQGALRFGETSASAFGISNRAALEAAGTFGNMLVPMGISRKEAARLSIEMVKLGSDMASFNNASPEETLHAIRSGLAGESEPLRRFGVDLREAALQEFALSKGIKESVKEMSNAEKAQLAYKKILFDTKDAQGDFARTSDSLANRQRQLKAQLEDIAASLGTALLPGLQKGAAALADFAGDVSKILNRDDLTAGEKFDRIGDEIAERLEAAVPVVTAAAAKIGPKIAAAMFRGFVQAPALVQLLAGAWIFAKARKLLAAFGLLGKQAGASFAAGAATTAPAGAAAGVGAGAAGGAAVGGAGVGGAAAGTAAGAGGLSKLATKLKPLAKKAGFVGVGIAVADAVLNAMELQMDRRSPELNKRLEGLGKGQLDFIAKLDIPLVPDSIDKILRKGNIGQALQGLGIGKGNEDAKKLQGILDQVAKSHVGITAETVKEGRELARNLDLTKQQRDEIGKTLREGRQKAPIPVSATGAITDFTKGLASGKRDVSRVVTDLLSGLDGLDVSAQRKASRFALNWAAGLRQTGHLSRKEFRVIKGIIENNVGDIGGVSMAGPRKLLRSMGLTFDQMVEAVQHPTSQMGQIVADALEALGEGQKASNIRTRVIAKGLQRSGKGPAAKMIRLPRAQGGFIGRRGERGRDEVPMELRPNMAVATRHQQPVFDFAERAAKRMRAASGGVVPVIAGRGERVMDERDVKRTDRNLAATAAAGLQPYGSVREVFKTVTRPHYLARGGFARGQMVTRTLRERLERGGLVQHLREHFERGATDRHTTDKVIERVRAFARGGFISRTRSEKERELRSVAEKVTRVLPGDGALAAAVGEVGEVDRSPKADTSGSTPGAAASVFPKGSPAGRIREGLGRLRIGQVQAPNQWLRDDSNVGRAALQAAALPTELRSRKDGAGGQESNLETEPLSPAPWVPTATGLTLPMPSLATGVVVPQQFARGGAIPRDRPGKAGAQGIVPIPGQPGESIHQSILADVQALIRRYKLKVTDGYAPSGHAAGGEHPKGLAIDAVPGAGGSWDLVDKLAKWAEPRQGSPRDPFRWVGYTGDSGHGRGNHLHLSWGGGGEGVGIDIPKLPQFKVTGRNTAPKNLAEAGIKKVRAAAQKFLDKQTADADVPVGTSSDPGGGGAAANKRLARSLMKGIFPAKEFGALSQLWQGESGWDEGAVNPSSGAGGIPQALPASKMGKGWQGNARQQIAWGLKYIKERYGSPSAALSAWQGRSPHWYAQGGFVEPQEMFAGGAITSRAPGKKDEPKKGDKKRPPKGLKKPPLGGPSPGKAFIWDKLASKWKRRKRKGDGFQLKQLDFWDAAMDKTIPTIQERIANIETGFDLAEPEHYPDERTIKRLQGAGHNIEKLGDSFIDWSAVDQSKSFLGQILGESFKLIGLPFGQSNRGVMEILRDAVEPIQASITAIVKRLNTEANEIRAQVRDNLRKLRRNEKRVETLDGKIDKEQGKKKPDRKQIREWREEKGEAAEQSKALRKQNRSLTGESDPGGDLAGIEKGRLGDVQVRKTAAETALEDFQGDRETLVGQSGVGGEFASVKTSIAQRVKDLGEISTERIREAVAPIGPDPSERDEEIKRFTAAFANISREFSPNFRSLPRFQRGGIVPGFGEGDKVPALLEPHEGIINKRAVMSLGGPQAIERINKIVPRFQTGGVVASPIQVAAPRGQQQMVVVKQDEPKTERQLVEQHLHFVSPPEEQYGVQKNALAELQNSL